MTTSLEQYGTGIGIPLGAGVGATAALLAGLGAGFGVLGGLVVGGFAGRYAETTLGRENWADRVVAVTLLVSLLAGGLLGVLTAWMVEGSMTVGFLDGSAAGGAFSLLTSATLITAGRDRRPDEQAAERA
jgi:hypothetical protein